MKIACLFGLLAFASAECPNACSGHGECGQKDMCSCYNNYQGNDCSERTCYFGIAHVDTPKGDLNADGTVSGPLTTVITGSEVYPWGTTEQYPNADANEGHFYMECSNKGICDRKSGECECFDGYEGTACVRASCPNDCSGHGTCESIKELAEQKGYDSNAGDVPTTTPNGATHFNALIEESFSYDLWDADKTMGCKCDPVYYGADCSSKKCKYGVDPLFFDDFDGVIHQTTVVHLGAKGTNAANIGGTFSIDFYDVFGEKYTTKPISAATSELTSTKVVEAFEALPNGVVSRTNTDVTRTAPSAVTVSVQTNAVSDITTSNTLGAGASGAGAGLGTYGSYGPEFTVTFSTNPGVLKTIELDTRQVTSQGTADYWVANMRQGQFSSRYTNTVGRVNTLLYGSKYLYTNGETVAANDLLKVNGQEFLAEAIGGLETSYVQLNEPFLGASILPILTDTGAIATAIGQNANEIAVDGVTITTSNTDSLKNGARLYTFNQPFSTTADHAAAVETLAVSFDGSLLYFDANSREAIYRRTDDPDNQNFYGSADTGAISADGFCTTRGGADIYPCDQLGVTTGFSASTDNKINSDTTSTAAFAGVWTGVQGPYKAVDALSGTAIVEDTGGSGINQANFGDTVPAAGAAVIMPVYVSKASSAGNLNSGATAFAATTLLMNGRRYKVASNTIDASGVGAGKLNGHKITLTETFSGQHLLKLCDACVDSNAVTGQEATILLNIGSPMNIPIHQGLLLGSATTFDSIVYNSAAFADAGAGAALGTETLVTNAWKTAPPVLVAAAGDVDLYQLTSQNGFKPVLITEASATTTYQYVSQCSNRGTCDGSTGVCSCFKGYTNDNCDTQNMLAM